MRRIHGDEGFTLVETVVAMLVFAILSTGFVAATITISRMSSDNRARIVATSLAAQATDAARLAGDPFAVGNQTTTQTVSGRTYTIARTAAWVDTSGADTRCGASTALLYKRISISVTWQGQSIVTQPVQSDTLLASTTKITDASSGAILVSVQDAAGAGRPGVTVTITPSSGTGGGTALTTQPAATDGDGCTYAKTVLPGSYDVRLSAAGHLDSHQVVSPKATVSVTAGSTVSASFQYDLATGFTIVHAANAASYNPPSTPLLPTNLTTTLVPTGGTSSVWPVLVPNTGTSASAYPADGGYAPVAGALTDAMGTTLCASFDPGAWPSGTSGGVALNAGSRATPVDASPGGSSTVNEPMGLVTVQSTLTGTLVATPDNPTAATDGGNPGCTGNATSAALTFGNVLTPGTVTIALPYGAWVLSSSTALALSSATPISNTVDGATPVYASGLVNKTISLTLDPRSGP